MTKRAPHWLITADTQLGAVHWGNTQREEDYYRIFQRLCTEAVEDGNCLGILGLGDIRERASIQAKNLGGMNRGLKILLEGGKHMLALMGNHDYTTPNWIEEMCYPCLENLTDPQVQARFGFDPDSTLALDFVPKGDLARTILARCSPEKIKVAFLHQSLRELTTSLKQSHDTSLADLAALGFGKLHQCLFLIGDLHNYGDATAGNLTAAYPGSPEMTDINEGTNGLKSDRVASEPHDYRKFAIRYFPETNAWEPFELNPRPWFRGKAKTEKEAARITQQLGDQAAKWKMPGCIGLSAPRQSLEKLRAFVATLPVLEARVEEYAEESEEKNWAEDSTQGATLSWVENKEALLKLAEDNGMDSDCIALLKEIVGRDGSTPNPKNDIGAAWEAWSLNHIARQATTL